MKTARKATPMECWSCPATTFDRRAKGWRRRPMPGCPAVTEIFCQTCFEEWGWPPVVAPVPPPEPGPKSWGRVCRDRSGRRG